MTAIKPLEFVHKKGIFGDHQKKNENELLQITEVHNLVIVQVFKYKKANIEQKNLKIDGLEFPKESSLVSANNETRILWSAPRTWLIISTKEKIVKEINENCNENNFSVTDISHSRAIIKIKGSNAREVLKKGCPLNINEIKKNICAGTIFHGITIVVDCIEDKTDDFNLLVLRSFGGSFYHHITDAALEFGYVST